MTSLIWHNTLPQAWRPSENTYCGFSDGQNPTFERIAAAPSLTAALRALPHTFTVRLLHLGEAAASPLLGDTFTAAPPFCRDVYLCLDGIPAVWARSQCPPESAFWRDILNCGSRPLGETLFGGLPGLSRSPLQYARPRPGLIPKAPASLLARRSFFTHQGQTLGLTECFLPTLAQLAKAAASAEAV